MAKIGGGIVISENSWQLTYWSLSMLIKLVRVLVATRLLHFLPNCSFVADAWNCLKSFAVFGRWRLKVSRRGFIFDEMESCRAIFSEITTSNQLRASVSGLLRTLSTRPYQPYRYWGYETREMYSALFLWVQRIGSSALGDENIIVIKLVFQLSPEWVSSLGQPSAFLQFAIPIYRFYLFSSAKPFFVILVFFKKA